MKKIIIPVSALIFVLSIYFITRPAPGDPIDEFNGVTVYYNGLSPKNFGRNLAPDGYNMGIKYQCVEYIKRYYYEYFGHKMPDTYGHAKHFFNPAVPDGGLNTQRNLIQCTNLGISKPQMHDIVVLSGIYGHVGIISNVTDDEIEIVQQNTPKSRGRMKLIYKDGLWKVDNSRVTGWLRLAD